MALPIGSVVNYWSFNLAGDPDVLVCDGYAYPRQSYPQLFGIIGGVFGNGDTKATFNVPDLRGRFIRAPDSSPERGAAGVDPDASTRTAMNPGGLAGNAVGSIQADAHVPHVHALANTWGVLNDGGPGGPTARSNTNDGDSFKSGTLVSTGSETRPTNAAFVFVMYFKQPAQRCPIGTIVAYGGNSDPVDAVDHDVWMICDGRPGLPDLRGYFLRGLPSEARAIGSVQQDAFESHTHGLSGKVQTAHVGQSPDQDMGAPGSGGLAGTTGASIGGAETRPINAYLNYIMRVS